MKGIFQNFLSWLEEHQIGILVTIIAHLLVISLVLILKITTYTEREYTVMVDLSQIETNLIEPPEVQPEQGSQAYGQNSQQDNEVHNIPVNRAAVDAKAVENINQMIRDIKTEMNITDPQDHAQQLEQPQNELLENEAQIYDNKYPVEATGERTVYKGPTTVSYELSGRRHVLMPVPVYKCQGRGTVTVDIVVNPNGYVLSADINKSQSGTQDPCLIETAVRDALRSRFNRDSQAAARQQGTITYVFIAQ